VLDPVVVVRTSHRSDPTESLGKPLDLATEDGDLLVG
jgi:hypothetical protein